MAISQHVLEALEKAQASKQAELEARHAHDDAVFKFQNAEKEQQAALGAVENAHKVAFEDAHAAVEVVKAEFGL